MRAALAVALLSGCSLVTDTSDLAGGVRDGGVDGAPADTSPPGDTCVPDECASDLHVVKLADIAPCSASTTDNLGCRGKIAAACKALNPCCYKGGYGPLDFPNAAEAAIYCLIEAPYTAPFSELTAANGSCVATAPASRECDRAAHLSSLKRGHSTAILQSVSGANALLIGQDTGVATEVTATWGDLAKHDPGCTLATLESQACTTAVHRFCLAQPDTDYLFGYGPVAWTMTGATVACIW